MFLLYVYLLFASVFSGHINSTCPKQARISARVCFKPSARNSNFDNSICHRNLITITDVGFVHGLAVDPGVGKLYFSTHHEGKIEVANLNGSGRETIVSHEASRIVIGVALDLTDG